jgi:hypothetical protein
VADNFTLTSSDITNLRQSTDVITNNLKNRMFYFKEDKAGVPIVAGYGSSGLKIWAKAKEVSMTSKNLGPQTFNLPNYNGTGVISVSLVGGSDLSAHGLTAFVRQTAKSSNVTVYVDARGTAPGKGAKAIKFQIHLTVIGVG